MTCLPPTLCGRDALLRWSVSASVLNILWGEVWPRLVALWWRNDSSPIPTCPITFGILSPANLDAAMLTLAQEEIAWLNGLPSTSAPYPAPTLPGPWNATRFQRRLQQVRDHLNGPNPIPIRFIGEHGYDFVLSDAGLDLFSPKVPDEDWEWYRYYAFRRTGRAILGVPDYLEATETFLMDAPTGAGQVLTTGAALGTEVAPGSECTLGQVDCLAPEDVPAIEETVPGAPVDIVFPHRRLVSVWPPASRPPSWKRSRHVRFRYDAYLAALSQLRCWQLEGAVYRAILEELPRVVAEMWMEESEFSPPLSSATYSYRFRPGVGAAREIFEERVETSLPRPTRMVFEVGGVGDVTISNRGMEFPPPPQHPDRTKVLNAIIQGRAGNPVFTDSKRPEREG